MELKQVVKNVVLTKACNIKADKDSSETKQINLKVSFDGVTLADVFNKALSGTVIQWQNGPGRKRFSSWNNGQVVEVEFKAPAVQPTIDPETAMVGKLQGMTPEEQAEYLKELMSKAVR